MLAYIYQILDGFRKSFSRHSSWVLFCTIILGFIGADEIMGITSICRFWEMGENGYHSLLHFFKSSAWSIKELVSQWQRIVLSKGECVESDGDLILLGDHTHVPKDGRKMPGVVTLKQDSETQTKPSYFRGHFWGLIGLVVGREDNCFCLPIDSELHQGFKHIGKKKSKKKKQETSGERIMKMATNFVMSHGKKCTIILDAFFPLCTCFPISEFNKVR